MEERTKSAGSNGDPPAESSPPLFRSWRRWYAFLIGELIILVVLFRILTTAFA